MHLSHVAARVTTVVAGCAAVALLAGCSAFPSFTSQPVATPTVVSQPRSLPSSAWNLGPTTCGSQTVSAVVEGRSKPVGLLGCAGGLFTPGKPAVVTIHQGQWIFVTSKPGEPFGSQLTTSHPGVVSESPHVLRGIAVGSSDVRALSGVDCNSATGPARPQECVLLHVVVEK